MKKLARPVAIMATSAALLSPLSLAAGANASAAASPASFRTSAPCTLSTADRAAILDRLSLLHRQLAGTRPTRAEIRALHAAIAELTAAARAAKLSAAARAAKRAELARLTRSLRTAGSPTARVAIRAEIKAIRTELRSARLTRAERASLHAQAKALRAALWGPTAAAARALRVERARLKVSLRCHPGAVSVPAVAGL